MNTAKLGDSFDFVKRTFLGWLRPFGEWRVQPMCTDNLPLSAYEKLIGATAISTSVLSGARAEIIDPATACQGNLFLDPDTGIKTRMKRGSRAHISLQELIGLAQRRSRFLTAVFDQSISHGSEDARRSALREKLGALSGSGILAFAYLSHACFLVASQNEDLIR